MIAYSYIRFSTPDQLEGDSLRRQTEAARAWAERNNATLDTKTTFRDLGRSGFSGEHLKNAEVGGLATFLAMVEKGSIPKGSFLVCENADRLTRQGGWDAIGLFHKLVMADIRIVLLSPVEQIIDRTQDTMKMMFLLMELARGHGESDRKRQMIGDNWKRWKDEASETKEYRPGKRPFWLDRLGNGYALNDGKKVVELVYELAAKGWGMIRIAKELREKEIMPIKPNKMSDGYLSPAYLKQILHNPSVYGRCEELDCDDFFPAVMTKDEWFNVQGKISGRTNRGGGTSDWVHLLKSLVVHHETGAVFYPHLPNKTKTKVYLTSDYKRGGKTPLASFPVHAIEEAVCACVRELDWESLFPNEDETPQKINALNAEIMALKGRIAEAQEAMEGGAPLKSLVAVLGKWEGRIDEATKELKELQIKVTPKSELFTDIKALLSQLKSHDEAIRLQVKLLIARVIDKIEVEFRGWGKWRGAWCRVRFHDTDSFRDIYIIYHKPHRVGDGKVEDYLKWECQKMVVDAEAPNAEDVFEYLQAQTNEMDAEFNKAKRERKRLVCAKWHKARKKIA